MFDVVEEANRLVAGLGRRPVGSIAYTTAWAARLVADNRMVFPQARSWLRDHQHSDGSWGGTVPAAHDRLVSTLAVIPALSMIDEDWAIRAVRDGASYLLRHEQDWRDEVGETIGFEIIASYLARWVYEAGFVPAESFPGLDALRAAKLARFSDGVLSRQPTTLLYSLEAADGQVAAADVAGFLSADGSMASNPAATGAVWEATGNLTAYDYLHRAYESAADGGMPEVFPIDIFEPVWILYLLSRAGLTPPSAAAQVARLAQLGRTVAPQLGGLGISEHFPIPDSDDTAMVANVLHANGYDDAQLAKTLLSFEADTHFVGFEHERGIPVSANGRILEVFARRPEQFADQIAKLTAFLLDARCEQAWWYDKWHLSAYYAAAQAVFGLITVEPDELAGTWRWLLDSQHSDGSWGLAGGQPEETAHAVLALDALAPSYGPVPADIYSRAHRYLTRRWNEQDYAELWIGKGLYTPISVVQAAILAGWKLSGDAAERGSS
jgi:halimadienyl-diphosphate synthase